MIANETGVCALLGLHTGMIATYRVNDHKRSLAKLTERCDLWNNNPVQHQSGYSRDLKDSNPMDTCSDRPNASRACIHYVLRRENMQGFRVTISAALFPCCVHACFRGRFGECMRPQCSPRDDEYVCYIPTNITQFTRISFRHSGIRCGTLRTLLDVSINCRMIKLNNQWCISSCEWRERRGAA